eukprot:gnl/Spiro4/9671_TR5135_c0_g1_i1.p1 gnl/Spiro4/9671_TR5135_c0_g1~~gnl/Spiro4/9671_TR5135_c0_g1_i1.p1  ORF type:complete len:459 (+),score=124.08 gnl/Spiro4/9671_TR5135_c0_g1_i1:155-1378(+)
MLVWKELNYGKMSDKEKQLLVSEVNILRELKHPHIVRYYDRIIDRENTKIYIVTEHCEGGDLASLISKCRRERVYIDEEVVWKILVQLVLALKECHHRKEGPVLHRDIKPANVFLDAAQNVKLGDFGLARVMGNTSMLAETNVGTPFYMSPEQINEAGYNTMADIWSLGCLVYELCSLSHPFEAANQLALAAKIRLGKFHKLPSKYSSDMCRIVAAMLQVDASKRPSVDDLLSCPPIALRLRERKVHQHFAALRKREEDVKTREEQLNQREEEAKTREEQLNQREEQLRKRELALESREQLLSQPPPPPPPPPQTQPPNLPPLPHSLPRSLSEAQLHLHHHIPPQQHSISRTLSEATQPHTHHHQLPPHIPRSLSETTLPHFAHHHTHTVSRGQQDDGDSTTIKLQS